MSANLRDLGRCVSLIARSLRIIDLLERYREHPILTMRRYGRYVLEEDARRLASNLAEMVVYCPRVFGGVSDDFENVFEDFQRMVESGRDPVKSIIDAVEYKLGGLENLKNRLLEELYAIGTRILSKE